jgi:hypothetical protein
MAISPLSGILTTDNVGNIYYFGDCEEGTNGFVIDTTPVSTHTQYKILLPTNIPYITPSSIWKSFGTDGMSKSATIDDLCSWSGGGYDYRYARILFKSERSGGTVSNYTIEVLIEKYKFNVSVLPSPTYDNGALFGLSRYGTCFVRPDRVTPYVFVGNGTNIDANYFVLTNTTSVEWMCNSTFNEQKTGTFGHTGSWLFIWGLGLLWNFAFGWIDWKPWYILIIVFVLMFIFPTLYLIWRDRRG